MRIEDCKWLNAKKEDEVLCDIIVSFPEFKRFIGEERPKIGFIFWIEDPDLPDGLAAGAQVMTDEIHFREHPISLKDSLVMAHEIMHLIRFHEGEALLINYTHFLYAPLVAHLGNMLEDPVIDSFLQERYNFDLLSHYGGMVELNRKNLKMESEGDLGRLLHGFDLANLMLCWDFIKDQDARNEWSDYLENEFQEQYPHSYKIGLETAAIARNIGLDSIEQRKEIFYELIDKYNFRKEFFLMT